MSNPNVVLTLGDVRRLAGADVGSLTLEAGLAAYSDQDKDGKRQSHVLKEGEQTSVSEKGDVILVGLADTTAVTVHADAEPPKKKEAPKTEAKPEPKIQVSKK